ncbi:MAG: DsbA family oxidoreductase [Burkholderiaceae bacterium]|jgi:predicted DsbA family dithiol-disulfide isomerase
MQNISIEIISDVVCPWCYVGLGNLRAAVALAEQRQAGFSDGVQVQWSPYMLNPDLPPEGIARSEYLQRKFGTTSLDRFGRVKDAASAVGLPLRLDLIQVQPNSLPAHVLVAAAGAQGHALTDLIFEAFFVEGRNIADPATLIDLAEAAGMERSHAEAALADVLLAKRVRHVADEWREHGVSGVPTFILKVQDRQQVLHGAVSHAVMLETFYALGAL